MSVPMQSARDFLEQDAKQVSLTWLSAASLYGLLAVITLHATIYSGGIATVWPANAVLVAVLLCQERRMWATVLSAGFVGNIVANLVTRGVLLTPMLYYLCNIVEIAVVVLLLRGGPVRTSLLSSPATVVRFILAAGVIAPLLGGFGGASVASLTTGEDFQQALTTWVLSDGLGLLIFTPVTVAIFNGSYVRRYRERTWGQRAEAVALLGLTAAMAWLVFFYAKRPLMFALFAPVMLVTFRMGGLGTKLAVMLIAVIGADATVHKLGPVSMITSDPATQAQLFQIFIAVLLLTCLPVAAELSARRALALELTEREKEMSRRAATDSLTGLRNRAAFQACVETALAAPDDTPLALLALDLDNFKRVNDQWGHHAGDQALVHLSNVLTASMRERDIVGRIGGDEFLVLLPRTGASEAETIAERVRDAIRRAPLTLDDKADLLLTISCGVTTSKPGQGYASLARQADRALYLAKDAGRNAIRFVA